METRRRNVQCATLGLLALCALAPALAQTSSPAEPRPSVEQFVNQKLAVWQERLQLEEWRISVVMTRRSALKSKTLGGIRWDKGKKSAELSVLDPADYSVAFTEMLDDMEFTIVHELVHLELASLPRSEASRSNEEHAVNRLTEALLRLNRRK